MEHTYRTQNEIQLQLFLPILLTIFITNGLSVFYLPYLLQMDWVYFYRQNGNIMMQDQSIEQNILYYCKKKKSSTRD